MFSMGRWSKAAFTWFDRATANAPPALLDDLAVVHGGGLRVVKHEQSEGHQCENNPAALPVRGRVLSAAPAPRPLL
jgi:hypothetical protein